MIVKDEALLQEFREKCRCECCGEWCPGGTDAAHVFARGMGGGGRMDVRINLVSLKRAHHRSHHDGGKPTRADLLKIVAKREGLSVDELREKLWALVREAK